MEAVEAVAVEVAAMVAMPTMAVAAAQGAVTAMPTMAVAVAQVAAVPVAQVAAVAGASATFPATNGRHTSTARRTPGRVHYDRSRGTGEA